MDLTYELCEVWMEPEPSGERMMFCSEKDGFASTSLEFDLNTPNGLDWEVTEVRMVEPIRLHPRRKVLTGKMREDAIAFLQTTEEASVSFFISSEFVHEDDEGLTERWKEMETA